MNRRTFLMTSALAPLASTTAANDPRHRIRIAQIGTSHAHAAGKMDAIRSLFNLFDVVGYAEPIASRQPFALKSKSFAGIKQLTVSEILADRSIDVVVIETTLEDSARCAFAALKAGKHIHLDKPGADKHDDFAILRRYADQHNLKVQMGYMLRYNPAIQLLVRAVKEGWLGDIMEVDASMGKLLDDAGRKQFSKLPGGGMFELACHLVDTILTLLGTPTSIQAFGNATRAPDDNFVDNQLAILNYPKATVTVRCNHADPLGSIHRYIVVRGTRGDMEIRPLESGKGVLHVDTPRDTITAPHKQGNLMVMAAKPRFVKGENTFELVVPKGRYDEEFKDLHRVLTGATTLDWSAEHDISVHSTSMRAAGLIP